MGSHDPLPQMSRNNPDIASNSVDGPRPVLALFHSEETPLFSSSKCFQIVSILEQRMPALLQPGTFPYTLLMKSHIYLHIPGPRQLS